MQPTITFKFLFSFLFFHLFLFACCRAQDLETLLTPLSPPGRVRFVCGYIELKNIVNTPRFEPFLRQVKFFAEKEKDALLLSEAEYLINGIPIFKEQNSYTKIELIKKSQETYQRKNDLLHVGDCLVAMGQIQFASEQYAPAFENLLAAAEIFKKLGYAQVPKIGKYLHDFALDYFFFREYEKAILYMKESIKLPKYNDNLDIQRYNTLGMSYLKLNELDSAHRYLDMAYKKAGGYRDSLWMGLSAGNIGEVLYLKGKYQKALGYFLEDYRINSNSDFPDLQQNAALNLSKNYIRLGSLDNAFYYLQLTRQLLPRTKTSTFGNQQLLELARLNYYEVGYRYYLARNDYRTSLLYADSLHHAEKIRDQKYNTLQVEMASGQLALLQSKMMLQKKELAHEQQRRMRNMIILSLVVLFLLSALIFRNRQVLLRARLERAAHHLKLSELKLNDFAAQVQEKSKLVADLKEQLEKNPGTDNSLLQQLQQATILTDSDWVQFKMLFEQVHSGFLHRLREKYPEISPAEIRYLTLAKLRFSTREMAAALGVSTQSIRTNWYRIRKKLNLPETFNSEELVATI
ncbi:tetratricopeptide repeat protein [Niabella hirudinis]|uniref:tetratricopeptide repeat protein n=1 Tax=Niabella hirudinis TaxID=1285929 RepID=UPI003EBD718E